MQAEASLSSRLAEGSLQDQNRFPFLPVAWMLVGLFCLVAFILEPTGRVMVGGFATIVVTIPLIALYVGQVRWFHPMILVLIPAAIGVGLRSWYLLYAEDRDGARRLLLGLDAVDAVMLGSGIVGIGLTSLLVGYLAGPKLRPSGKPLRPWETWTASWQWTNVILLVSITISAAATLLYFQAIGGVSLETLSSKRYVELDGGTVSSGAFYSRAAAIPAFVTLPLIAQMAKGAKLPFSTKSLILASILGSLVAPFVASSRSEIIALLTIIAITWSAKKRAFSLRIVAAGLVGISILLVMGSLRCEHQTQDDASCSVSGQVEGSLLANESWLSVTKTAHIISEVPGSVNFQYGRTIASAVVAPVPRVLWPEKPAVRADLLVGFEILDLPSERRTGAPPGIVGEFYLNWSWPGVITGMFILGWFLRAVWDWSLRNQSDFAMAAYAIIGTHLALRMPAGDFTGSFLPAMQGLVTLAFVMIAATLFRRDRKSKP